MKKIFLALTICFQLTFAQSFDKEFAYGEIDPSIKSLKYNGNLSKLVFDLTKDYPTEIQKARAIYIWITDNISYDYKTFNKKRKSKTFKCKSKDDCERQKAEWKEQLINKTLKKKKGICGDYAELFKKMCNLAGISCEIVVGYTKTEPSQIGKMGILDHGWNVLIIDKNYYYLDLTWASGYCTKNEKNNLDNFIKKLDDYYWLTPIDKLSRSHFPKDTLQLVNSSYNKTIFKKNPYIQNSIMSKIDVISPDSGVIDAKIGDTILFKFTYRGSINKLQMNTNIARNPKIWKKAKKQEVIDEKNLLKQKYVNYKKENDDYSFIFIVESNKVRFIEILFDYRLKLKYLIKVKEAK
jgi:hypothetical protein